MTTTVMTLPTQPKGVSAIGHRVVGDAKRFGRNHNSVSLRLLADRIWIRRCLVRSQEGQYEAPRQLRLERRFVRPARPPATSQLRGLARMGRRLRNQGEVRGRADRADRKVDVKERPVQVIGARPLHLRQRADARLPKPRKVVEAQEELLVSKQQPEAVPGDVGDLRCRSDESRHRGSLPCVVQQCPAPERAGEP